TGGARLHRPAAPLHDLPRPDDAGHRRLGGVPPPPVGRDAGGHPRVHHDGGAAESAAGRALGAAQAGAAAERARPAVRLLLTGILDFSRELWLASARCGVASSCWPAAPSRRRNMDASWWAS